MFTIFVGCCFNDIHYPDTADICHQHQRRRNTFWSWFTFSPAKCERDCFVWSLSREFSSNSWDLLQNTKWSSILFFAVFFKTTFICEFTHFSAYNLKASNWCCCTKNLSGNPYIEKHKWRRIFGQCLKEQWGGYCSVPLIWIDDKREKVERTNKYDGQAMSRFSP